MKFDANNFCNFQKYNGWNRIIIILHSSPNSPQSFSFQFHRSANYPL